MNVSKVALAISAAVIISGCGGESSNSGKVVPKPTFPQVESKSLSVTVIDGYLEGATVWLDKKENQNFLPDGDEPRAVTNKQGVAVFNDIDPASFDKYVLVAKATAGKTVDHDNGKTVANSFYLTAPLKAGKTALLRASQEPVSYSSVITPLTTLVEMKLRQPASSASEASIIAASKLVAEELGLNADNVHVVLSDFKKLSSADATKAEQAAVSLVVSGVMPATVDELSTQFDSVLTHASTVNSSVKGAAADELVIHDADAADSVRVVKKIDSDGDGLIDALDAFPEDDSEWYDTDGDGKGNNADTDDDGDGVDDEKDTFPLEPSEDTDTDTDSIGNNEDSDDDNDGIVDTDDALPLDSTEHQDNDNDGVGDNKDADDDNDKVEDGKDAFPYNPQESKDTDNDGIGNNSDDDDDGDGYIDSKDNDPLTKLVVPESINACLDSLPDYPAGVARPDTPNGLLYSISRLNSGQAERSQLTQIERYIGQRDGLPDGNAAGRTVDVTQVTSVTPGAEAGIWNPSFELMYVDADNHQYLGSADVFRRWWSVNMATNTPDNMKLNEVTTSWVDRIDNRSPEMPVRHENISSVYVGKEIIDTLLGYREVCVVKHDAEFEWTEAGQYAIEKSRTYLDKDRVVVRGEKDYLEYNLKDKSEPESKPTWGYTDSVKVLTGMVHDGQQYGQDVVTSHIPSDQPVTMDQCLADLPDAGYEPLLNDSLQFDMYRFKEEKDPNTKQIVRVEQNAKYDFITWADSDVSWHGQDGLLESRLSGLFYHGETFTDVNVFYSFAERYFDHADGTMAGFEARENGGDVIVWGQENTATLQQSFDGSYFMPEVHHHEAKPLNATEQKASFKQVQHVVFAGAEQTLDRSTYEMVPACKYYSRLETTFYQADGSPSLDIENKPVIQFIDEVVWRDNKGIINRDRKTDGWDSETWHRTSVMNQE